MAEINSVNAREIYDYLGLAKGQFSRWIKTAIEKYDFIQNEDFLSIDRCRGCKRLYCYS